MCLRDDNEVMVELPPWTTSNQIPSIGFVKCGEPHANNSDWMSVDLEDPDIRSVKNRVQSLWEDNHGGLPLTVEMGGPEDNRSASVGVIQTEKQPGKRRS